MTEPWPLVAQGLAAGSAVCAVAGLAIAFPRSVRPRPRRWRPDMRWAWLAVAGAIGALAPGPGLVTIPLAMLLGDRVRRLAIARSRARERSAMDEEIPQLLDLLAAGSAAGLSAVVGLERSVSGLRGPLGGELRGSLESVELGARWREELAAVTERLALPDLQRAVTVLARTDTLGTSLTDATRELAADVRSARRAAVAERARAAPVKMLFPLVFLVLPAFLLLTVVPVLLTTVRSIS
ncbi:MAG TPA: type II secretion system F family protein [Actinomycetota bacterium]|nr:type II secretion system F family protein [Actinomycetota bacterium]